VHKPTLYRRKGGDLENFKIVYDSIIEDQDKLIYYSHSEEMLRICNPEAGFNDAFYDLNMSMFEQYISDHENNLKNISHSVANEESMQIPRCEFPNGKLDGF
jgi:hypothetical protein